MRIRLLALLLALLGVAGCASQTDGSPSSQPSVTGSFDEPSPSVADPVGSAGPSEGSSDGPADASAINPCALVTKPEADKVAGTTLLKAVRSIELCTFPTPTSGSVGQLEVYVGDGAKKFYDIDKTTLKHEFHAVPGVGDQAGAEDGAIFFHGKGLWFGLRVVRLDGFDTGPLLAQLAAKVLERV